MIEQVKICKQIRAICEPLFQSTDIHYFHYIKVYKTGLALALCSDEAPLHYCVDNNLCPTLECWDHSQRMLIWSDKLHGICAFEPMRNNEVSAALKEKFNLDYVLNLVQKHEDYYEFFGFGTHKDNAAMMEFYLCEINKLNEFRYYFIERAETLIEEYDVEANWLQLYLPQAKIASATMQQIFPHSLEVNLSPKKFILSGEHEGISLSKREVDTLRLLARGKTMKEVAKILAISPRTIEKHLNSAKAKLNCNSKTELCTTFLRLGI
jgi:DNA-binding CsgD family transcriptional regulator